jgi:manganese/zinc/iron transport system permease protein
MMGLAAAMGAASAVGGYWLARWLDVSIAGAMAATVGFVFLLALALAPQRGLVAAARRRAGQRLEFALAMLTIHLAQHQDGPDAADECRADRIHLHLHWESGFAEHVLRAAEQRRLLRREGDLVRLDESGRVLARGALTR